MSRNPCLRASVHVEGATLVVSLKNDNAFPLDIWTAEPIFGPAVGGMTIAPGDAFAVRMCGGVEAQIQPERAPVKGRIAANDEALSALRTYIRQEAQFGRRYPELEAALETLERLP